MWRCVCRRARIYLSGDGAIVINGATSSHIQDTARRMPTVAKPTNSSVSMSLISQHGCGTTWLGPSSRLCNTTYVPDVFGPHSAMSGLTNHRATGTAETIRIQKYQPQLPRSALSARECVYTLNDPSCMFNTPVIAQASATAPSRRSRPLLSPPPATPRQAWAVPLSAPPRPRRTLFKEAECR